MFTRIVFLTLCLAICPSVLATTLYKWTDEAGVVHYSENPPAGVKAETLDIRVSSASQKVKPTEPLAKPTPQEAEPVAPDAVKKQKPYTPEQLAVRKSNCERATTNLEQLEASNKISVTDPETNERRKIGEEERQQLIAQSKQQVANWCD